MKDNQTIIDYFKNTLMVFGITIIILNILCIVIGNEASNISSMFILGNRGISVATSMQFLLMSAIINFFRSLFFSYQVFKDLSVTSRIASMLVGILITLIIFITVFKWFPLDNIAAWIGFILSFTISFLISVMISNYIEKKENQKMSEALAIKQKEWNK